MERSFPKPVTLKKINLGCGSRFHPEWTNVNFTSTGNGVIAADISKSIPFPDESFDVVYHSHLLEHLPKRDVGKFIIECGRVLKSGGVLRIAVPDLEAITRTYLEALGNVRAGSNGWVSNYEWVMLEIYDQIVRNHSGGEMAEYLLQDEISNKEFIIGRCGVEAKNIIEYGRKIKSVSSNPPIAKQKSKLQRIWQLLIDKQSRRERKIRKLIGEEGCTALQIGRFRMSGEVHQWMYDSYSLSKLLGEYGFINILKREADQSYIPKWPSYNLDTEPDGSVYRPDSLFVEAVKA